MSLTEQNGVFVAEGVIDGSTPEVIRTALKAHPQVRTLVLKYVPGSADDVANLEAARMVRANGMETIVPPGGLVASGGTDLFLAGQKREVGPGACLGVHSWYGDGVAGNEIPKSSPHHTLYLDYYDEMGIDQTFYWYTLDAAGPNSIHYMSNAELARYDIATTPLPIGPEATAQSCEAISEKYGFS